MPKKHGISHGLATLFMSIFAAVIGHFIVEKLPFCRTLWNKFGHALSNLFFKTTGVYITPDIFPIAILAALFAFGWGAAFALMHKD